MTETARTIVNDILLDLKVRSNEEPIPQVEADDVMRAVNRYMAKISSKGIDLGFTKITKLSDPLTIPDGALDAIVANVALRLWPTYRKGDPPSIMVLSARDGWEVLVDLGVEIAPSSPSGTLPYGSGNVGKYRSEFYPEPSDPVELETNAPILIEDDTEVPE